MPHCVAIVRELHERGEILKKNENVFVFLELEPSVLYRIAALPDEIASALACAALC